jgi:hypothetical protein
MADLLMVLCNKRHVQSLVEEFTDWKAKAGIELEILLYGITHKNHDGFLLLELKQPLPEGVYTNLVIDTDIVDYIKYTLPPPTTPTPA